MNKIGAQLLAACPRIQDGVGIIPVNGCLYQQDNIEMFFFGGTSYGQILNNIDAFEKDASVKAIILDINSPGGDAAGAFETAERIRACKKPTVAYVGAMAASAGYLLAAACRKSVAHKTAFLGSVGVVHCEAKRDGEKLVYVVSDLSPNKVQDIGTPEGVASIKAHVNSLAQSFVEDLAEYRGKPEAEIVAEFGQGDLVNAKTALQKGMIDAVGNFRSAWAIAEKGEVSPLIDNGKSLSVKTNSSNARGGKMAKKKMGLVLINEGDAGEGVETQEVTAEVLESEFPEICQQIRDKAAEEMNKAAAEVEEVAASADMENPAEKDAVAQARSGKITAAQLAKELAKAKMSFANSDEGKKRMLAKLRGSDNPPAHTVGGGDSQPAEKKNYAKAAAKSLVGKGGKV